MNRNLLRAKSGLPPHHVNAHCSDLVSNIAHLGVLDVGDDPERPQAKQSTNERPGKGVIAFSVASRKLRQYVALILCRDLSHSWEGRIEADCLRRTLRLGRRWWGLELASELVTANARTRRHRPGPLANRTNFLLVLPHGLSVRLSKVVPGELTNRQNSEYLSGE